MSIDLGLDIAQSLTAITILWRDLADEALHRYADSEFPGGMALVELGPVANMEAYTYRQLSELMGRTNAKGGEDDDATDDAPALLVLASWHDVIRDHRGLEPSEVRATITREADAIRGSIDWMLAENADAVPNFLPADELARDLRHVRTRLENVLKAGERDGRTQVPCTSETCDTKPNLIRPVTDDGLADSWRCPACRAHYDVRDFISARHQHMYSERAADSWLTVSDAAHSIERPISTLRTWIRDWKVSTQVVGEKPSTMYVLWSDVRQADLDARVVLVRRKPKGRAA